MSGILNSLKSLTAAAKHGQDTRMRFSVVPPPPGDSGFEQWRDAMRMVARLPGGIPPEFRRRLWLTLAEKHLQSRGVDWSKAERMCLNEWRHPDDEQLGIQIVKDLHRTGCSLFCGGTEGAAANQAVLKRVLLGYARWNKVVGYCQGFNMLAALILQVTERSEADAIKVMIFLIEGVLPEGYFADHLRGLSVDMAVFRDLLRLRLPALSRHLETLQHDARDSATGAVYEPPLTNVFTMQWFLTLFCNCLPRAAVLRVWDLVFLEGSEVLLRTALAIWDGLQDRIMAVGSADEFYSIMGVLTREMLEFGLMDSNNLIKAIVSMGPFPFPGLSELRDRHLYNITPWSRSVSAVAKRGLGRIFYAGEEEDEEEEEEEDDDSGKRWGKKGESTGAEREAGERLAVATAFGLSAVFRSPRRRDSHPPAEERALTSRLPWSTGTGASPSGTTSAPPTSSAVDRERLSLDVWALRRQYSKLRERQRQAHVILTAACARQMGPSPSAPSHGTAVNHLLLGKSALLPPRGRRRGPPPGSVPAPLRRIHPPPPAREPPPPPPPPQPPEESGETLLWRDAKRRQGRGRKVSESGSSNLSPLDEVEDVKPELKEDISDEEKEAIESKWSESGERRDRRRSRTYSSDSGSSSSTELCDEDAARLSDLDSSGEAVSPVPPKCADEENTRIITPLKSPIDEEEPAPVTVVESTSSDLLWENMPAEDGTSKEGRLSSSTMTPGLDEANPSPQETTGFTLPELYIPPASPTASKCLSPSSPITLEHHGDTLKSPLEGSPQNVSPFSSPTTSSASDHIPSTTSSPGPLASSPTSSKSSPSASSPKAVPKLPPDDLPLDVTFQPSAAEADEPATQPAITTPETKEADPTRTGETKAEEDGQSPVDLEFLLSKYPHLRLRDWSVEEDTVSEEKEKSPTPECTALTSDTLPADLSPLGPISTSPSEYNAADLSKLLPSTSISLPLPVSSSTTPPLDLSPIVPAAMNISSSTPNFSPLSTTPPPLLPATDSPPPLLPSSRSPSPVPYSSHSPPPLKFSSSPPPFVLPSSSKNPPLPTSSSTPPPSPTSSTYPTTFPISSSPPSLLSSLSSAPLRSSPTSVPSASSPTLPHSRRKSSPPSFLRTPSTPPPLLPTSSSPTSYLPASTTPPPIYHPSPPPSTFLPPSTTPPPITPSATTQPSLYRSLSSPPPLPPSTSPQPVVTSLSSSPPPFLPPTTTSSLFSSKPYYLPPLFSSLPPSQPSSDPSSVHHSPFKRPLPSSDAAPAALSSTSYRVTQLTKPFSLPSLPLRSDYSAACDTDTTSTVKPRDRTSLSFRWDWLPEEAKVHKITKSGSSPSSLLGSPDGAHSRTLGESQRTSPPPKVSPSLPPRRHSERALRIIQENSEILQRMLRQPPPTSPPSPTTAYPSMTEKINPTEGDSLKSLSLEAGEKSPHSPSSPASSSWPFDTSTDVSISASSKSPATSPVALGDVVSWAVKRGNLTVAPGPSGKLSSPNSPPHTFNPFPQRSWRQPKELGVKLGLYSANSSPSPPVSQTRSSPTTPTSPLRSHPRQTFK